MSHFSGGVSYLIKVLRKKAVWVTYITDKSSNRGRSLGLKPGFSGLQPHPIGIASQIIPT